MNKIFFWITMLSLLVGRTTCSRRVWTRAQKVIVPYKLPSPSTEQQDVVNSVKQGFNVIVDSCAGSGKTTTVLHLAKAMPQKNMLLLTYNSRLKEETRGSVKSLDLSNLECHSYHACCQKYFSKEPCLNDKVIKKIINNSNPSAQKLPFYDVIIIDEAQDMIELYHKFLHKILHDLWLSYGRHPQLLVIGDEHQELYGFKGADFRYLTMAENIYPFSVQNNCWKRKSLKTSYRITGNIATFINECVLMGNTRMIAAKPAGHSVDYYVGNPYDSVKKIAKYLIEKLNEGDDAELREQLMDNKIVFSSFHQSKGLERKFVVVFDFSISYFSFYGKQLSLDKCPTAMYVAVTRAIEKLIVVAEETPGNHLPFLDRRALDELSNGKDPIVKIFKPSGWKSNYKPMQLEEEMIIPETVSVTQLISYTSDKVESKVSSNLRNNWVKLSSSINRKTSILTVVDDTRTKKSGTSENVADINGIAIPAMLEYKLKGSSTLFRELSEIIKTETNKTVDQCITKKFENLQRKIPQTPISTFAEGHDYLSSNNVQIGHFLELAALFQCAARISSQKAYLNRIYQFKSYNWISEYDAQDAIARLEKAFFGSDGRTNQSVNNIDFEKSLYFTVPVTVPVPDGRELLSLTLQRIANGGERHEMNGTTTIAGRVDVVTDDTLWEIKCVTKLTDEHKNQLLVYAWLHLKKENGTTNKTFKILNVYDGELWELKAETEEQRKGIYSAVKALIKHYFDKDSKRVSDAEFVDICCEQVQPFALVHPSDNDAPDSGDSNKGPDSGMSEPINTPSTTTTSTTASMTASVKPKRIWVPKTRINLDAAALQSKKEMGIHRIEETIKCLEPLYMKSFANCDEEQQREKKQKRECMEIPLESYIRSSKI